MFLCMQQEDQQLRLPYQFKFLLRDSHQRRSRLDQRPGQYDENGFKENCQGVLDPQIIYSHDGISHGPAEKEGRRFVTPKGKYKGRPINNVTLSIFSKTL